ncbi:MAG: transposase domain-containing protein, partial [Hyphomicrobium sp.]
PFAYLKDVLERMSNGHPASRLDDLLPWNWAPSNPPA